MTVVPFVPRREADPWRLDELVELDRLMRLLAGRTGARSWETGVTERGEPQFDVIGPQSAGTRQTLLGQQKLMSC